MAFQPNRLKEAFISKPEYLAFLRKVQHFWAHIRAWQQSKGVWCASALQFSFHAAPSGRAHFTPVCSLCSAFVGVWVGLGNIFLQLFTYPFIKLMLSACFTWETLLGAGIVLSTGQEEGQVTEKDRSSTRVGAVLGVWAGHRCVVTGCRVGGSELLENVSLDRVVSAL